MGFQIWFVVDRNVAVVLRSYFKSPCDVDFSCFTVRLLLPLHVQQMCRASSPDAKSGRKIRAHASPGRYSQPTEPRGGPQLPGHTSSHGSLDTATLNRIFYSCRPRPSIKGARQIALLLGLLNRLLIFMSHRLLKTLSFSRMLPTARLAPPKL